jgi:catechol 2,3-dioxygenase-like lactoylglutathione lyase family enzyme
MSTRVGQQTDTRQETGNTTTVASTVIRVSELERSVNFYCDVFLCRVALRDSHTALLLTPDGFQIYLSAKGPSRRATASAVGVQYLMWATDNESELERIAHRLRAHDLATYTHTENGVTFVEGSDPDHGRVIVSYPSPQRHPREFISTRFHV